MCAFLGCGDEDLEGSPHDYSQHWQRSGGQCLGGQQQHWQRGATLAATVAAVPRGAVSGSATTVGSGRRGEVGFGGEDQEEGQAKGKTEKSIFRKNVFFHYFKLNLGGLGVSGGMAWTIRRDSLELWHGIGEVDFHVFCKYWKLTSSPNTSKLVLWPPDWSSDFC